jgi:hypothetical protein
LSVHGGIKYTVSHYSDNGAASCHFVIPITMLLGRINIIPGASLASLIVSVVEGVWAAVRAGAWTRAIVAATALYNNNNNSNIGSNTSISIVAVGMVAASVASVTVTAALVVTATNVAQSGSSSSSSS